jgi:hypothetical protein
MTMKAKAILSGLIIMISISSFSQDPESTGRNNEYKTLLGVNRPGGFYGAFTFGYSEIDNRQAVIFGGRLEWIINHSIGIGFGGNGFVNEYYNDPVSERDVFLTGGYGGFYFEPIILPNFPAHLSFPILLGAGGISYITKDTDFYHNMIEDSEVFLLVEPAGEIELNVTRNFRLAFGASYRFTTPFDIGTNGSSTLSASSIEGWSFLISFKFGRF